MQTQSNNATVTFKGQPMIVKASSKGWLTLEDNRGVSHKARAKEVQTAIAVEPPKPAVKVARDPNAPRAIRKIGSSVVRHFSQYEKHKTATGNTSYDTGDELAVALRGLDLDGIYAKAAKVLGETVTDLKGDYQHLNVGMQRMNLGNRIRGALKKAAQAAVKAQEPEDKDTDEGDDE